MIVGVVIAGSIGTSTASGRALAKRVNESMVKLIYDIADIANSLAAVEEFGRV